MKSTRHDRFVWDIESLDADDLARFGGKGVGLARMVTAGIPVPPGFVIGTDAFRAFHARGAVLPATLEAEVDEAMLRLERRTGKRFGETRTQSEPLLVAVRSGAPVSMPGMMDTVLNLGLDAPGAFAFGRALGMSFALDTWLRFWRMFAEIVLLADPGDLERDVGELRTAALATPSLDAFDRLQDGIVTSLRGTGLDVAISPAVQLRLAIAAVFASWNSRRAKAYRKNLGISDTLGTAVTVQTMVFGNRDAASGSGVAFSCNPNSGESGLYGEYVVGRQGEDLVSGVTTPVDLSRPDGMNAALRNALLAHGRSLEALYRDAVDIEFTVESNRLYLLQVRSAKRTAEAAVRIAVGLLQAGTISREEAVRRVTPAQIGKLLRPTFEAAALEAARLLATGIGSSPGHASGAAILDADAAADRSASGERVILLRPTTSPQDIRGMLVAEGIVTARGGALSHAAVVSRALDKPCIVGCESIVIDLERRAFSVNGEAYPEGTMLSVDGESGNIFLGDIPVRLKATGRAQLSELVQAADELSQASVTTSALDFADIARAAAVPSAGTIVGLTDLIISAGSMGRLTTAIGALGDDARRTSGEREIESLAREVAERALRASGDKRVAFRLPSFLSERARRIVPSWATLPARALLPLGERSFYAPLARGVAAAAQTAHRGRVSLLLGGVTEPREIDAFMGDSKSTDAPAVGALLRSLAALHHFARAGDNDFDVWLDADAIVRSCYGFPTELMATRGVFEEYLARKLFAEDPQTTLAPFLVSFFESLLRNVGPNRAGILSSFAGENEIASQLYSLGYRRFCVPTNEREQLCLQLAREAIGTDR